ncbi:MAG TPA: ABC transporter substrate-binding protein [Pyrinomonadaceae bacterium]|nr:ABC transporter substrate-binding protein [Pyrinomonadaceae bacterium]
MIGQRLSNRYDIKSELGRGGMGVVYRASDPLLNRDVAIKLIPPTLLNPDTEQRFQREAQLVAQMDYPAVVPIFDFGKHEGSLFFVMPVIEGTNLRWFQRDGTLTLGEVIDIGIQVAEALEYSHSRGVTHRDIKPENIMVVREDGARLRVRIMDFGLARGAAESRITKTGTIAGTLSYMSPEQVAGGAIDHRTDIYSLGTVLYECLTGEPPFSGELQSILYRIVHEIPQPPRAMGSDINEDLEQVILSCIVKEPEKRPQRASEVADSLRRSQTRLHQSDLGKSVVMTKTMMMPRVALSPFIGRAKEQAELQKRLNAAISGECQFVIVSGEPGVGKTRLLDELESLARARKLLVLHGRSIEQDGAFPYQGFCEAIQEYFRLKDTGSSPHNRIDLSDVAPDLISLFPMLTEISEIRGAATGDSKLSQLSGSQGPENRTQIFELLARTLTRLAAGKPLLLFLEDLHAAEISIEALQYIVRRLGPTPTLIVSTYRSSEVDSRTHPLTHMLETFRGDRRFSAIDLGPFSQSEHRLFLETLIGGPKLADSLVEKLFEATEGNPFFTKELVRSLLDSGGIAKDQTGAWSLGASTDLSAGELPATIQQAVTKRIERLPEELREILSLASVVGKSFDVRDLEALAGEKDVEDAIDRLIEEGLLEEERESRGDRLTFSSGVVRDVLYGATSRRKRRSLHRKHAEEIEKRHRGRLERVYPQLVHHYSQGDVAEKTVEYGLRMSKAALDAFSPEESARAAKTVLEFLDDEWRGDAQLEGEARILLAQAYRMAGDIEGALREANGSARVFGREGQKEKLVAALLFATDTAWQARKVVETTRLVQQATEAARSAGDTDSLRHMLSLSATLANLRGEYEQATQYLEEATSLAPAAKESEPQKEIPNGGRLVVAIATPLGGVDPVNMELIEEQEILANVFETLLATDLEGNLIPSLCEKWEVSDDGTSVSFALRENVCFQNGQLMNAESVKNSFERSIRVARELPPGLAAIRGAGEFAQSNDGELSTILVKADYKLEIQLSEPLSIYPALLTDFKTGVTLSDTNGMTKPSIPIGTGPFRITSYRADNIVIERNEKYWKGSPPHLDNVEFRAGLNAAEISSGLRSGDIDLARDLSPQDLEEFLRDTRLRSGFVESPRKNTYFVIFNCSAGSVGQNGELRRALSGIVRTHDLVWQTLGRFAQPAVCLIPPGMLGYDPGRRRQTITRDEAAAMLRAAGVSEQIKLRAAVHPLLLDRYKALLTSLLYIWEDLGVNVEVVTPTMASYLDAFQNSSEIDLFIGRWNVDYDDPDDFTYGLFHSRVGLYRTYVSSADGDQILEEARIESRPGVRSSLYRKYETFLQASGMVLPLFHDVDYRIANARVAGLTLRGSAPYVNYAQMGKLEVGAKTSESVRAGGGILQVPITGTLLYLDPSLAGTVEDAEVLPSIFETLTRDLGGARIGPWLAASYASEQGGKRFRFRLRDDVRFHDGRKVTARDVRYSLERLLLNKENSGSRFTYSAIRGAKALLNGEVLDLAGFKIHSTEEFTIELEEPMSFFPALLSYHAAAIVPEGSNAFGPSWQDGSVGTGPFRVVKFEPGIRLELERNKTYWRPGYPKSEGITFNFGVTPTEILSQFRAGRFSLASDLLPADAESLRREAEFASGYHEIPRLTTYYLVFNTHRGPLKNKRLRQTLATAIDVATIVRQTLGRIAVPAQALIPPGLLGHDSTYITPQPVTAVTPERPGDAIELTAVVNPVFFGEYAAFTREISRSLGEQNVTIRIINKTMEEWLEAVSEGVVDLVLGRWVADFPDADTFASILASKEGLLGPVCGLSEVDQLVARGRTETSSAARHVVYRQIEDIIVRDRPLLPLFHEQAYRFARLELEGMSLTYDSLTLDYSNLSIRG